MVSADLYNNWVRIRSAAVDYCIGSPAKVYLSHRFTGTEVAAQHGVCRAAD